jgi:hypothetical protein
LYFSDKLFASLKQMKEDSTFIRRLGLIGDPPNDIAVFHFGGHADSFNLLLQYPPAGGIHLVR